MRLTTHHAMISVLVRDQEEALRFYTEKLGLEKRRDISYGPGLRLLTVAPRGQQKPELALAHPDPLFHSEKYVNELMSRVGQCLSCIFTTEDCGQDYLLLQERGVACVSAPTSHIYGIEALFQDPYGNMFSLLQATPETRSLLEKWNVGTAA